jgi:hypothetical protein
MGNMSFNSRCRRKGSSRRASLVSSTPQRVEIQAPTFPRQEIQKNNSYRELNTIVEIKKSIIGVLRRYAATTLSPARL